MPRTIDRRSSAEWEDIIDRFVAAAPGTTQVAFCEANDVPFDAFRNRYRKSPKFVGKRRRPAAASAAPKPGGFVPVRRRTASIASKPDAPAPAQAVTIRLAGNVVIDCPLSIGVETIAQLAREVAR